MNFSHIDLRLLRSFIALAKSTSYTNAADSLHITQSALSQQMRELSRFFSHPIFERKGRRSTLTAFGLELLERVEPMVGNLDEELLKLRNTSRNIVSKLKIGATNTYLKAIVLPACLQLLDEHSDLQINLKDAPAKQLIEDLNQGLIDMAILPEVYQTDKLRHQFLFKEQFCVIGTKLMLRHLPKNTRLRSLGEQPVALLDKNFLMRQKIEYQCKSEGIQLHTVLELSAMSDLLDVAKAGKIVVIGSGIACRGYPELIAKEVSGEHLSRDATLYWRTSAHQTELMKAVKERLVVASRPFSKIS